ncbi:hypothetical protein EVAR_5607_1 [Eumeta japonica]|uniref:Uncharacterized protein n=1 Tax=Eumeta variegata TaxID=151549 RepID=A0A4C1U2W6_EUMVA|nr:hypothetical protein EVAR_5607_1 [Eumeta japonica]
MFKLLYYSTSFTYEGRTITAMDAPNPLQFIDGVSACTYVLYTLQSKERGLALHIFDDRAGRYESSAPCCRCSTAILIDAFDGGDVAAPLQTPMRKRAKSCCIVNCSVDAALCSIRAKSQALTSANGRTAPTEPSTVP